EVSRPAARRSTCDASAIGRSPSRSKYRQARGLPFAWASAARALRSSRRHILGGGAAYRGLEAVGRSQVGTPGTDVKRRSDMRTTLTAVQGAGIALILVTGAIHFI